MIVFAYAVLSPATILSRSSRVGKALRARLGSRHLRR